jgi:hypothetical protein
MASWRNRASFKRALANVFRVLSVLIAAVAFALPGAATAGDVPTFAVDASWPKPLPNNWILGQVGGITVDWQGHIWVIHRPRSLTDDEKGASLTPLRVGTASARIRQRRQSAAIMGRRGRRL